MSGASLADQWSALASSALLGSDRRPCPAPPPGPLEDLVVARADRDPAEHLLDQVSLLASVRRAGLRPNPPAPALLACPIDARPPCPPAAVVRLGAVLTAWPQLLDEWLARVTAGGWSLPPEIAVELLAAFRADPVHRSMVVALSGDLADWLAPLFPELAPRPVRGKAATPAPPDPLPDDMARLARLGPDEFAATLATALSQGHFANRHRPLLVRLLGQVSVDHLAPTAAALARAATHPDTMGLTLTLSDLAQFRLDLIRELSS